MPRDANVSTFSFGVPIIIPSTRNAYKTSEVDGSKRKQESDAEKNFSALVEQTLSGLKIPDVFPTENEIFVVVVQFFIGEKEYKNHDIDNICRTVLNNLNKFVASDRQVKTLLGCKKIKERRVKENFAYILISALKKDGEAEVMRSKYMENAIQFYESVKRSG